MKKKYFLMITTCNVRENYFYIIHLHFTYIYICINTSKKKIVLNQKLVITCLAIL